MAYNNKKYEKGSIGYYLELAKKDGFDNIKEWNKWRIDTGKLDQTKIEREYQEKIFQNLGYKNKSEYFNQLIKRKIWENIDKRPPNISKNERKSSNEICLELAKRKGFQSFKEYREDLVQRKGFKDFAEYHRHLLHEKGVYFPMSDNPDCPMHLGIHIAERKYARKILPIIFEDIIKEMPPNNPGFDFICKGDQKIDVKARMLKNNKWSFPIRYNNIADQFLCIGFNNNEDKLEPIIILLIHRDEKIRKQEIGNKYKIDKFYRREALGITNNPKYLMEFQIYNKINDERVKKVIEEIMS